MKFSIIMLTVAIQLATIATSPAQTALPAPAAPAPSPAAAPDTGTRRTPQLSVSSDPTFDEGSAGRINVAIQRYQTIATHGGWPMIPAEAKFTLGTSGDHDATLRRRLVVTEDLAAADGTGPFDANMVAGIKHFQTRHGLKQTGNVGPRTLAALNVPVEQRLEQLKASLQRISAIGFNFGERYVAVDIPGAFVEAVENRKVVHRYRVVVGKTEKPSPTVAAEITDINLNPRWTVPASITKNEIAAHMRKDPGYLSRMHMQTYDSHDAVIDAAGIDWSADKTPNAIVRQEPGPWNALGQIKINMPNAYAVYMHDTNQKSLLSADYRFDSHGCVRVEDVKELAAWLLKDTPEWDLAKIDSAIATGERQTVKLSKKVPVAWIYLTAWMTADSGIQFRDDVYEQDAQLLAATTEEKAFFDQAARNAKTQ